MNKRIYFLLNEGVKRKKAVRIIGNNGIALTLTENAIPEKKQANRKFLRVGEKAYFKK